jgi:two-component system, NarL family, sensor kinase
MENTEVTYLILFGSITFILFVAFIIIVVFRYHKRNSQYQQQIARLEYEKQQELLQSKIEIQDQTLVASLIKINLNTLKIAPEEKAFEQVAETKDLVRQLIADIKALSVSLGSDQISQTGLVKALETAVARVNKTGVFTAIYEVDGIMPELDKDKALIIYRMSQEILNNMVKHSEAKRIKIYLHITPNLLRLAFNDDGVGFDMDAAEHAPGVGLRNLKNRASIINATFNIHSLPGTGTEVTINLPI